MGKKKFPNIEITIYIIKKRREEEGVKKNCGEGTVFEKSF